MFKIFRNSRAFFYLAIVLGAIITNAFGDAALSDRATQQYPLCVVADATGYWKIVVSTTSTTAPAYQTDSLSGLASSSYSTISYPNDYYLTTITGYLSDPGVSGWLKFKGTLDGIDVTSAQVDIKHECSIDTFYVFLIDRSGSMFQNRVDGGTRFNAAKLYTLDKINNLTGNVAFSLMFFDDSLATGSGRVPRIRSSQLGTFTCDKNFIVETMDSVPTALGGGLTPLADGLCEAGDILSHVSGTKVRKLVCYTDGYHTVTYRDILNNICATYGCNGYPATWSYNCDPLHNTGGCSAWQTCLYNCLVGHWNIMDGYYFVRMGTKGDFATVNLETDVLTEDGLAKGGTPDMDFIRALTEATGGTFTIVDDSEPLPVSYDNGDVDCDGIINIKDVMYLINFIYKGGVPPCDF
jgi:hypothetical protein